MLELLVRKGEHPYKLSQEKTFCSANIKLEIACTFLSKMESVLVSPWSVGGKKIITKSYS